MADSTVADLGEIELVGRILDILGATPQVECGPGDDAAVVASPRGSLLLTTDSQREGVHFLRDWLAPEDIGRRAVAVAVSDVGAMGGMPRWALCALAVPATLEMAWLERLCAGMSEGAAELGCAIVGGDVGRSGNEVSITITALGELAVGTDAVRRDGARPGHECWVTGRPGRAAAGRRLLADGVGRHGVAVEASVAATKVGGWAAAAAACVDNYARPMPRMALGAAVAREALAAAMIDVSDGLGIDLGRLCAASGVGARLDSRALADSALALALGVAGGGEIPVVLGGGDDYELLCAVAEGRGADFDRAARRHGVEARRIGCFNAGTAVELEDGDTRLRIDDAGWDHFAGRSR